MRGRVRADARTLILALACLLVVGNIILGLGVVRGWLGTDAMRQSTAAALAAGSELRTASGVLFFASQDYFQRGGQEPLDRWRAAQRFVAAQIGVVRTLTAGQTAQLQRLDAVQRWLDWNVAAAAAAVPGRPSTDADALQKLAEEERRFDAVRQQLAAIQQQQLAICEVEFAAADRRIARLFLLSAAHTLFSAGLIVLVFLLVWRDRRARAALLAERTTAVAAADRALRREAAERRHALQALRSREMMLRGIADAMPQMVFVLFRDGTGEFINRRWQDYTGTAPVFRRDEALGRVHPEDADDVRIAWRRAVKRDGPFEVEFRLRGSDGAYRWFLAQSVPVRETEDEVVHWVGALTDIDDIRRSGIALRDSEDRFRRIFEGSPFGITLSSGDHRRILQANPAFCQMLGYPPNELIGQSLIDLTHPDDQQSEGAFPRLVTAGPGWRTREKRYVTRQGGVVWARIRVSVFDSPRLGEPQLLAVVEDITRQRALDEALRQAQRMEAVGQLSGGVAHDFNNLLGVIIGNIECLLETLAADEERRELAQEVLDSALSGAELTRRLLAFGRRQSLSPRRIDLSEQAAQHVTLLRRTLGRSIRVDTTLAEDLWPTRADPSQLGDALLNLAINARDAMPDGGVLTIATHNDHVAADDGASETDVPPGDYAVLAVSDTGIGMPPEVRTRAVEPFFTTKAPGAGSGLGLSMIYGFVRQSGGHLTIASEVGIGTTVSIYLPRMDGPIARAVRAGQDRHLSAGHETILLVDDSAEMREVAERHLRFLGYAVLSAENGPAALAVLRSDVAVDLLFTDIAMPEGMNGLQLAEAAVAMRPGLKVLFTTGYAGMGIPDGLNDWQDRLIRKPYRRAELAEKLRRALAA